jgi:hypothetical protein
MAGRSGRLNPGAGASPRALALTAFVIALGLLAWRGSVLLTSDSALPVTATPLEASLMNIIDPVVGTGNARISVNTADTGARTVLVLLDAAASSQASTIEGLVTAAARMDVAAGDLLITQKAEFVRGTPGRPDTRAYGELAMLALLVGMLGWMAFVPQAESVAEVAIDPPLHTLVTEQRAIAPAPVRTVRTAVPTTDAADLVRKDPARAADILRGWMANRTDAA